MTKRATWESSGAGLRRALIGTLLILAIAPGEASGSPGGVRSFSESIAIGEDGNATVSWKITAGSDSVRTLFLPWNFPAGHPLQDSLRVSVPEGTTDDSASIVLLPTAVFTQREGVRCVRVHSDNAFPSGSFEIGFNIPGFFQPGRETAGEFGNHVMKRKFLNTTLSEIGEFSSEIVLPPGFVVTSIEETIPKQTEDNPVSPYRLGRTDGRNRIVLTATGMKVGDQTFIRMRVKADAKSPLLLIGLSCIAIAYLVLFRDLITGGNGNAEKPTKE